MFNILKTVIKFDEARLDWKEKSLLYDEIFCTGRRNVWFFVKVHFGCN